jgi:GT2 family glycosyltransferase
MAESSIVIVTYNGLLEHTIPCLESIFRGTGDEDYEVIAVDNNSSDGTPAYLTELAGREPRLKCVLNATNRGFAGGNNDGIRVATGRVIVLLNNDTRVSDGWLSRMRSTLLADRSVGLVGPVSNAVGNEQKIFISGATPEDILGEGRTWAEMSGGDSFETDRLGFFCVAFRRDLLELVGLLDDAYDLGFYEDDDYCLRVLKAGYKLVCREDVFIYHHGSASFGKVPHRTKDLLKKNRRLLEQKFGIRYNPRHPRDRQLDLAENCLLGALTTPQQVSALTSRGKNRLQIARTLMPRSWLKRLLFLRRLRFLERRIAALQPPCNSYVFEDKEKLL